MNTILPILIILALGATSAYVLAKKGFSVPVATVGGAFVGTVLWNVGIFLLFVFTAPSELEGGFLWIQEAKIFFTALVPALIVAGIFGSRSHPDVPIQGNRI